MKTILSILTAVAAFAHCVSAQFVQGPTLRNGITNLPTFIFTSNVATAPVPWSTYGTAPIVPIGLNGFGVGINLGATNALTVSNVFFNLETSYDGVNFATNNIIIIHALPPGLGYRPQYTNIANTVANVGNAVAVRLYSVLNTNGTVGGLWVTNFTITTR
jgi:hypothetical protein